MTIQEAIEARHSVRAYKENRWQMMLSRCWFKKGVEAALLVPTAVNQQKFSFEYVGMENSRHKVLAKRGFSMIGYTQMDLVISKYHFEIGAGKEKFVWV
jgi:nitroreductase